MMFGWFFIDVRSLKPSKIMVFPKQNAIFYKIEISTKNQKHIKKWLIFWAPNRPKIIENRCQKRFEKRSLFWHRFWSIFGSNLGAISASQAQVKRSKIDIFSNLGLAGAPAGQKNVPRRPKIAKMRPKGVPGKQKTVPREAQEQPRRSQDSPKAAQELAKTTPRQFITWHTPKILSNA